MGFICAVEAFICSFNCGRPPLNTKTHYDKMAESSTHFTLHETVTTNQSRAVTDDSLQQKQGHISRNSKNRSDQYLVNENFDNPDNNPAQGQVRPSHHHHHNSAVPSQNLSHSVTDKSAKMSRPDENKVYGLENKTKSRPPAEGQSVKGTKTVKNDHHTSNGTGKGTASNGHLSKSCANTASGQPTADHQRTGVITKATVETPEQVSSEQHRNTGAIPKRNKPSKNPQQQQPTVTKPSTNHLDEIVSLPLDDTAGDSRHNTSTKITK